MKPLIILEIANNHMGSVEHGKALIEHFSKVASGFENLRFAFKFQYRDLDTFIHPSMRARMDLKFIKRFSETRLDEDQFLALIKHARQTGNSVLATPFDEASVDLIERQNLDLIKIASCSFGDWKLMERVAESGKPVIASTAGAPIELIDNVVAFFLHRNVDLTIMHCVGEYPTADHKMNVNQIEFLRDRYPEINIGFSTHEDPNNYDIVKLAISKGALVFEKHVGLPTEEFQNNAYSATPDQFQNWLSAIEWSISTLGEKENRVAENKEELRQLLGLRRGVFANKEIEAGQPISDGDVYLAFPPIEGQITTVDWGKYDEVIATSKINSDEALTAENSAITNKRQEILNIVKRVSEIIEQSGVVVPNGCDLELSHHYGLENFYDTGLAMITVVNKSYCKKLLICLPNQRHPEQYHKIKEETFHIVYGDVVVELDGKGTEYNAGDLVHISTNQMHAFHSLNGCVIEEISSTHAKDDSYYQDEDITANLDRKTTVAYWRES